MGNKIMVLIFLFNLVFGTNIEQSLAELSKQVEHSKCMVPSHDKDVKNLFEKGLIDTEFRDQEMKGLLAKNKADTKAHDEQMMELREEKKADTKAHDGEMMELRAKNQADTKSHNEEIMKLRMEKKYIAEQLQENRSFLNELLDETQKDKEKLAKRITNIECEQKNFKR